MKKSRILAALALLMWLTWMQNSYATVSVNEELKGIKVYEISETKSKEKKRSNDDTGGDSLNTEGIEYLIWILDNRIQSKILSYFDKKISLTELKKEFKKNIQKRIKIHKSLVSSYNEDLESKEYLDIITTSSLKIEKIRELKEDFFPTPEA